MHPFPCGHCTGEAPAPPAEKAECIADLDSGRSFVLRTIAVPAPPAPGSEDESYDPSPEARAFDELVVATRRLGSPEDKALAPEDDEPLTPKECAEMDRVLRMCGYKPRPAPGSDVETKLARRGSGQRARGMDFLAEVGESLHGCGAEVKPSPGSDVEEIVQKAMMHITLAGVPPSAMCSIEAIAREAIRLVSKRKDGEIMWLKSDLEAYENEEGRLCPEDCPSIGEYIPHLRKEIERLRKALVLLDGMKRDPGPGAADQHLLPPRARQIIDAALGGKEG